MKSGHVCAGLAWWLAQRDPSMHGVAHQGAPWNSSVTCSQMWIFFAGIMLISRVAILICKCRSLANIQAFEKPALRLGRQSPPETCSLDSVPETCQSKGQSPWCLLQKLPNMLSEQEWLPPSFHGWIQEPVGSQNQMRFHEIQSRCLQGGGVLLKVTH